MDILTRFARLLRPAGALLLIAACAHGDRREAPPGATAGSSDGVPAADAPARPAGSDGATAGVEPPREISTDRAQASDPGAGTPEREASLRIVEEGKGYLVAGRAEEAARRFDRAARIDPTNGLAYYWLGRARVEAGDRAGAVGVLEKAESLLGPYPDWRERAAELLASLR